MVCLSNVACTPHFPMNMLEMDVDLLVICRCGSILSIFGDDSRVL